MNTILQLEHVEKSLGKNKIIDDLSLAIQEQEIVGLIGPNGAGKSTTFKLITGLLFPDHGRIIISGHDLQKQREAALADLSAMIESPSLYSTLSGRDNLRLLAMIRKLPEHKLTDMINIIDIGPAIDRRVKTYSLGMKQRLMLGMCLLTQPRLLLLDEPTNGLDPTSSLEFRSMIITYARQNKTAVLICSHILSELEKTCDRFLFLKNGRLITTAPLTKSYICNITTQSIQQLSQTLSCISGLNLIQHEHYLEVKMTRRELINQVISVIAAQRIPIEKLTMPDDDIEAHYREIFL